MDQSEVNTVEPEFWKILKTPTVNGVTAVLREVFNASGTQTKFILESSSRHIVGWHIFKDGIMTQDIDCLTRPGVIEFDEPPSRGSFVYVYSVRR